MGYLLHCKNSVLRTLTQNIQILHALISEIYFLLRTSSTRKKNVLFESLSRDPLCHLIRVFERVRMIAENFVRFTVQVITNL